MRYASLRQGLVGCWCPSVSGPFGYRLPDLSGYGNHGTLTNMDPPNDWVVSGGKGALDFDGSNDGVLTNFVSPILTNRVTVSVWLKPSVLTRGDLVAKWNNGVSSGDQFNLLYGITSGKPNFYISTGSSVPNSGVGSDAMTTGSWFSICGIYDGQKIALYLGGKFQASSAFTGNIATTTGTSVTIGRNASTDGFCNGQLDDIRIYDRALSEQEIRILASERGIGLKPERQRNRYLVPALPSRNRSSRFLGFPS